MRPGSTRGSETAATGHTRSFLFLGICFHALSCLGMIAARGGDLVAQAVRDSGRPDQAPAVRFEGRVVDSQTRQALGDARVGFERGRPLGEYYARRGKFAVNLNTDQRGYFQFDAPNPGEYALVAEKRGYVPSPLVVVELELGKVAKRDVELDPMASLSGRVVDEANHPVEGARIGLMVDTAQAGPSLLRILKEESASGLTTNTNSQGEFQLFVPAEDTTVTLLARAPGYSRDVLGPLGVKAGQVRTGILWRLSRGLGAQGRIMDEAGAPVSGAAIVAWRGIVVESTPGFEGTEPRTTSGSDGSFNLQGLEKGTYSLTVSHAGHATQTVGPIEIQAVAANHIPDIVLPVGAEISGRIVDRAGSAVPGVKVSANWGEPTRKFETLSDSEGRFVLSGFVPGTHVDVLTEAPGRGYGEAVLVAPQAGVVLTVDIPGALRGYVEDADTKSPVREFRIWGVTTGPTQEKAFRSQDGSFDWTGFPPGRWSLFAKAPGYQKTALYGVVVRSGEPTEAVAFRLKRGIELAGRVLDDETGAGLPDVTVGYDDTIKPGEEDWYIRRLGVQTTDADGNFKFDALPAAKLEIIADSDIYGNARKTVRAGEEDFVEIRLRKGGSSSLSGHVVAPDGVTPVPRAEVSIGDLAGRYGMTTLADEAGAFSFDHLKAGRYQLASRANIGRTQPQEFVLQENQSLTGIILASEPRATIHGRVSGILPNERQTVTVIISQGHDFSAESQTNPDGTYLIAGVPPGKFQVLAETSSLRVISKSIDVPKGVEEMTLDFDFPLGARLHGRVTRAGQPVVLAGVTVSRLDSEFDSWVGQTDQDGMYGVDGLSEGDYVVKVNRTESRSVYISGDTIFDIELPTP